MSLVAVIDYGMGNLHSIAKALQHAAPKVNVQITSSVTQIQAADRIVFPGVGAIRDCMQQLNATGLAEIIQKQAHTKPFLGICLGMQALLTDSEENGGIECLNIIPGHVRRFAEDLTDEHSEKLKIPHMGWNRVFQHPHPLWRNIPQHSRFYFVHSYFAEPDQVSDTIGETVYPVPFACALAKDNLFAVQFHPEKSQVAGLQLLQNFLQWDGSF